MIWTPERKELAIAECKKWHSTPHRDRMAMAGIGVDCVRFVHKILIAAGIIIDAEMPWYEPRQGQHVKSDYLKNAFKHCLDVQEVTKAGREFGDIAIFHTGRMSNHCGFFTGEVWHVMAGQVVTHSDWVIYQRRIEIMLRIQAIGYKNLPTTL